MGHAVGVAQLSHGRRAVAAAHDGDGAALSQRLGQRAGALGKGGEFKHAHGPVPDHGARVLHRGGEGLDGLGPDVHAHAVGGDGHGRHQLGLGIGGELRGTEGVLRQEQLHALGLGLFHHLPAIVQPVLLQQGGAHAAAHGLDKGVGHASADDDGVGNVQQVVDDADLGGHLGPAQNGHQRTLGVLQGLAHDGQFLLDEEAGHGGQIGRHAGGGGMSAVNGAEGVGHVEVGHVGQSLGKGGVILLLAGLETEIFQKHDLAGLQGGGLGPGVLAHHIGGEDDLAAQQLAEALGHGGQSQGGLALPLGLAQMGAGDHGRAVVQQVVQGGQGRHDAVIIGDGPGLLVLRDVEVAAAKDPLALHVHIPDGLLVVVHLLFSFPSFQTMERTHVRPISPSPLRPGKPCWRSAS